jgi:hypothetical protein
MGNKLDHRILAIRSNSFPLYIWRIYIGKKSGLFNRTAKLAMIGVNVLVISEEDGKYSGYNSQSDKA